VRGTGSCPARCPTRRRFIPARAGNSFSVRSCKNVATVHPRACGEQGFRVKDQVVHLGSSPRVRGTVHQGRIGSGLFRFIPARAGNRFSSTVASAKVTVHPRACGEQVLLQLRNGFQDGSSPRVRGTVSMGRGGPAPFRFIPARAGNSFRALARTCRLAVHPRACGEQMRTSNATPSMCGSSPRVRGTVLLSCKTFGVQRFIPARAGNRLTPLQPGQLWAVHPRACGEQGATGLHIGYNGGSSPRVRGTGRQCGPPSKTQRFIPARAGNS